MAITRYGDPPSREECEVRDAPPGLAVTATPTSLKGFHYVDDEILAGRVSPHTIVRQLFQHFGFDCAAIAVQVKGYGTFLLSGGAEGGWELVE